MASQREVFQSNLPPVMTHLCYGCATISTYVRSIASVNTATSDIRSLTMGTMMVLEKLNQENPSGATLIV